MRRRTRSPSLGPVLAGVLVASLGSAQEPQPMDELKRDLAALVQGQKAIEQDLQDIQALLQPKQPAPPAENVVLDLTGLPIKGARTAPLTLVEFSDYQWLFCGRHVRETAPQLEREYIATGKLKSVFVDFPLESLHESAFDAAQATHCAGEQGKYWEMHDRLFSNQEELEPWAPHAKAIGLDVSRFERCLNSEKYAERIRKEVSEGRKAGVKSTPVFFLAYTDPDSSRVKPVIRLTGAQKYATFKAQIDKLLAEESKAGTAEKLH